MRNGPYELIVAPDDWPGKRYRGRYVYEHVYVYWKHTGALPADDEVVHHVNENKRDNRIENLELKSRSEHSAHHNPTKERPERECEACGAGFRTRKKTQRYCSRSCIGASHGRGRL